MPVWLANDDCVRVCSTVRVIYSYVDRESIVIFNIPRISLKFWIYTPDNGSVIVNVQLLSNALWCHIGFSFFLFVPCRVIIWVFRPVETMPSCTYVFVFDLSFIEKLILDFCVLSDSVIFIPLPIRSRVEYPAWSCTTCGGVDLRSICHCSHLVQ